MKLIRMLPFTVLLLAVTVSAQTPAKGSSADLVKQSEAALHDGKHDKALALAQQAVKSTPRSFEANRQAGIVSDLVGRHADARKYFTTAIDVASTPQAKSTARRSMAISYAFENNCKEAAKYEMAAYTDLLEQKNFATAAEVAYEGGDICLESGDYLRALDWYSTGRSALRGTRNADEESRLSWQLRESHARARLAARRGQNAAALEHLKTVRAVLGKGAGRDQPGVYPYLAGYLAFYDDKYRSALPRLLEANQDDISVLNLLAQTYEQLGNSADATARYRKIAATSGHDTATASALPLARSKLKPPKP